MPMNASPKYKLDAKDREPIDPKTGPVLGTAAELADWLGVTTKTVYQLADRLIVIRAGRGRYDLRASIRGYAAHMRDAPGFRKR
jgi:hypothetical protein